MSDLRGFEPQDVEASSGTNKMIAAVVVAVMAGGAVVYSFATGTWNPPPTPPMKVASNTPPASLPPLPSNVPTTPPLSSPPAAPPVAPPEQASAPVQPKPVQTARVHHARTPSSDSSD